MVYMVKVRGSKTSNYLSSLSTCSFGVMCFVNKKTFVCDSLVSVSGDPRWPLRSHAGRLYAADGGLPADIVPAESPSDLI